MTDEVIDAQVTEPSADQVENPAIAEQNAEPAPAEVKDTPKPDPVQKRIDKLTREKYQLRGRLEALERERETWAQRNNQPQAPQAKDDAMPRLEQFDNFEQFVEAKAAYIADQRLNKAFEEREQKQSQAKAQESQAQRAQNWQKQLDKARESLEDLDDVLESSDAPMTPALAEAIMESEFGPQVAYYLARNPQEAEKIAGMSPSAVARAVGRIEAKIESEKTAKPVSAAPKPVKPVSGNGAGASNGLSDNLSIEEWVKARNAQLRKSK